MLLTSTEPPSLVVGDPHRFNELREWARSRGIRCALRGGRSSNLVGDVQAARRLLLDDGAAFALGAPLLQLAAGPKSRSRATVEGCARAARAVTILCARCCFVQVLPSREPPPLAWGGACAAARVVREALGSSVSDSDLPLPAPQHALWRHGLRVLRLSRMTPDTTIATILTGIGVLFGVWRLVHAEIEGVRRDLTNQISAVNTRIDNVLLADRHGR